MNLKIIITSFLFLFIVSGCTKVYHDSESIGNGTIVVGSFTQRGTMWFCPEPSGQCVEIEVEEK
jgi:hypothetical protein